MFRSSLILITESVSEKTVLVLRFTEIERKLKQQSTPISGENNFLKVADVYIKKKVLISLKRDRLHMKFKVKSRSR